MPLKAIELLCVLVKGEGELVTKEEILDTVWKDSFVEESVLSQNIFKVRKTFSEHGIEEEWIKNIPRRGYCFTGEIKEEFEEEISIERSVVEKKMIAEDFVPDEEFEAFVGESKKDGAEAKQLPAQYLPAFSRFKSPLLIFSGLILIALVGTAFLLWNGKDTKQISKSAPINFTRLTDSGKAFFPAISRDNERIAYVKVEDKKHSIVVQHLPTQSETVVIKPQDLEIRSINFSADGNNLFYAVSEPDQPESSIYQIPIYGGAKRKLVSNIRQQFSLSFDGTKFAFFRYDPDTDKLYLMTAKTDGSDGKIIKARTKPDSFQVWGTYPAWSPDDKKLVVTGLTRISDDKRGRSNSYFLEIDVETGEENVIRTPDWAVSHQAFWLPDGNGLIASAHEGLRSPRQIWFLEPETGKARRITNDTNQYDYFRLSHDGKSILAVNRRNPANLYLVDLEKPEEMRQLTQGTTISHGKYGIVWAENGEEIIYVRSESSTDGNLWKINVKTGESQQLTFEKDVSVRKPETIPGRKEIVFGSNRQGNWQIWQIGEDGKNLKLLAEEKGAKYPEVSPDGKWLFYGVPAEGQLEMKRMPLDEKGESERVLYNTAGAGKISPVNADQIVTLYYDKQDKENNPWKHILFSRGDTENFTELDFDPSNHAFEWSRDGKGIYYPRKGRNENNIWYISVTNGKSRQITDLEGLRIVNLSVSPDGKTLAISSEEVTSNILRITEF